MTHHDSCEEMKHSGIVIDTLKHLHMGKQGFSKQSFTKMQYI